MTCSAIARCSAVTTFEPSLPQCRLAITTSAPRARASRAAAITPSADSRFVRHGSPGGSDAPLSPNVNDRWAKVIPLTVNNLVTASAGVRAMPDSSRPAASSAFTVASIPAVPRSIVWFEAVLHRS